MIKIPRNAPDVHEIAADAYIEFESAIRTLTERLERLEEKMSGNPYHDQSATSPFLDSAARLDAAVFDRDEAVMREILAGLVEIGRQHATALKILTEQVERFEKRLNG